MVAAGIAVLLFTACSSPEAPAPALSATQTFDAAGVVGASHRHTTSPNAVSGIFRKIHPGPAELAVSDFGTNSVEILNKSFQPVAAITQKIRSADGIHYDAKGNLYVANSTGPFVTEYNPSRKLIFTYSAGLSAAVDVTVDASGNVFVADFGPNVPSVVVEYAQRRKPPTATCSTGLANDGIAVDPNGNVFVSGFDVNAHIGRLLEYRGGLAGCQAMTLAPTMATAGGLQFDAHRNLLACDQDAGVDVIPRPYTVIARTIASLCFHEVLNKRQNRLYIAEPNTNDVLVDTYPAGTTLEKLGSANGLTEPGGVAAFPNAP
jgi:hypothetical protein